MNISTIVPTQTRRYNMKSYFFETDDWNGYGDIIIADNEKEALKFARKQCDCDYAFLEYSKHIRPKYADLAGITQKGKYEGNPVDMLRRGMYSWYECICPVCGKESKLEKNENGRIYCTKCGQEIAE